VRRSIVTVGLIAAVGFIVSGSVLAASKPARVGPASGGAAVSTPEASVAAGEKKKGRDGAACSGDDECQSGTCEGGSCCTDHDATCTSSSHCCGHQSCNIPAGETSGTCP
jgi:hypothetical protein